MSELKPAPLEPRTERRQDLVLRKAGLPRSRRQIVVDLDPVAFLELLRCVAADGDQVHRHAAEHGQRIFAGERGPARREAAKIAVGIADVEDRGFGVLRSGEGRAITAGFARADRAALDDLSLDARHLTDIAVGLTP